MNVLVFLDMTQIDGMYEYAGVLYLTQIDGMYEYAGVFRSETNRWNVWMCWCPKSDTNR
jgi:hypothetical protein